MADLVPHPNNARNRPKLSPEEFVARFYPEIKFYPEQLEYMHSLMNGPVVINPNAHGKTFRPLFFFEHDPWGVDEGRRGAVDGVVDSVRVVSELRVIAVEEVRPEFLPVVISCRK